MTLVGRAGVALLAAVLLGGVSAWSSPETPHQAAIDQAVASGLQWLADSQNPDGSWPAEGDNFVAGAGFGAMTFMRQGYDEATPYNGRLVVADAIAFILSQQKPAGWQGLSYTEGSIFWGGDPPDTGSIYHSNYETSVAVIALTMTGNPDYDDEIAAACAWLDKDQWDEQYPNKVGDPDYSIDEEYLGGFGYQCMLPQDESGNARPDLSNTQFSILGLQAAGALAGDIAQDAITYMHNCQGIQRDTLVNVTATEDSCASGVKWDPSGTRILYTSDYDTGQCGPHLQKMVSEDIPILPPGLPEDEVAGARYSPAADKIAFSTWDGAADGNRVFLVNPDGTALTELTGLPEQYWGAWTLAWSPDGTQLAITACLSQAQVDDGQPDIYIYDLATDTFDPTGLGVNACAFGLDWSPAASGPYVDKLLYTSCATATGRADIWMVDIYTPGAATNLTAAVRATETVLDECSCCRDPRWSPDGTTIAFASPCATGDGEIVLMDPDASNPQLLTDGGGQDSVPAWSPDGSKIAFVRAADPGGTSLMVMNSDGSGIGLAVNPASLPGSFEPWYGAMDWYVDSGGEDWVICGEPTSEDGGNIHHLELTLPIRLAPCGWGHEWSPDGDRVWFAAPHNVFDPLDPNENSCIWVADADGTGPPVNVSGDGPAEEATWSPDGSKLAFAARFDLFGLPPEWPPEWPTECAMSSIWVVDPDGIDPSYNLCTPDWAAKTGCGDQPDWGAPPDGMGGTAEKIAYHGWSEGEDIWTASPDGTDHVNLSAGSAEDNWYPHWSPDSTRIDYRVPGPVADDPVAIWVMDYDGSNQQQLSAVGGGSTLQWWHQAAWSPDSTRLAFRGDDGGDGPLYIWNADGLPPDVEPIPNAPQVTQPTDWPASTPWASDGSLITGDSCEFSWSDPVLFKADGYLDSGYIYTPGSGIVGLYSTGSMTAAAVWCLRLCGEPISDPWVQDGLDWLANNYTYTENPGGQGDEFHYYYLWSAARGFLGCDVTSVPGVSHLPVPPEDAPEFEPGWYYDFSQYLVEQQGGDGSWQGSFTDTFFALLILLRYGLNTPEGTDVEVPAGDMTIIFDEVTGEGLTTVIVQDELPAAPPADVLFPDGYGYEVATSAEIGGSLTIEVDYSDTGYPPVLGRRLSVLLWNASEWVDVTVRPIDTGSYTIRGQLIAGTQREWFIGLALDLPPVPDVKVMFPACTAGRPYGPGLFVADGDFSNPVRLTLPEPWPEEDWTPNGCNWGTWSPDGTRVAFTENDRLSILDLAALIRYPGQEPQPLLDQFGQPVEGWNATWSPDSQRLACHMFGEGLYVIDADGGNKRLLVPWPEEPYGIRHTRFSPDGSRIVFRQGTWQDNEGHLWVVEDIDDPGGPSVWQLTTDEAYTEIWPFWSPDGSRVAFTRAPRGWTWGEPTADIWVKDLASGTETQITDTPDIFELASGWNPLDGHIYFEHWPADDRTIVSRILPDGSGWQVVADLGDVFPGNEWTWLQTGAWIDGRYALPGETVAPKIGLADAENLAGVQARVSYTGCCDTLSMYGIGLGESILDWVMPSPSIGANSATVLAYAADPGTDSVSGALHLFDLGVTNDPGAQPSDTQLLAFDELLLADDWGDPIDRIALNGGVTTIPFAGIEVSQTTGPVGADLDCPMLFPVTVTATDRNGDVMTDCNLAVELGGYHMGQGDVLMLDPVTPSSVMLVNGTWSGDVALAEPRCAMQLLAHWEDIGGYSNVFTAISKGDINADCVVDIYDVIKTANMAIGRGEWPLWPIWPPWPADVNCDDEVNIFDIVIIAGRALDAMQSMGIGRAGAPPLVAPPTEPVIVTTDVTTTGAQVVVAVKVSNCAGLAGIQVELDYDTKKLAYSGVSAGELLTGASSWTVMANDLGGQVKTIAYTPSAEVLPGGDGTILTLTFNQTGKGKAKVDVTSVELADVEGGEIECQMSAGKGGGKGKK